MAYMCSLHTRLNDSNTEKLITDQSSFDANVAITSNHGM